VASLPFAACTALHFCEGNAMNIRDVTLSLTEALLRSHTVTGAGENEGPAAKRPPFTVTISREVGALGNTVGAEVATRLGWALHDHEIINKIAEEMGKPTTHIRGVDERQFSWLEECLAGLMSEYRVNPSEYLKQLIGTIRGLGARGQCVIVGRGANFILPPETTLRVRLVADLKDRINVIGRLRGISDRDARRWIEEVEKERTRFVQSNFGKDVADPCHYDLVLNTSRLSAEECADTIIHTLQGMLRRPLPAKEETVAVAGGSPRI
jgi:cytidylate kinase